MLGILRKFDFLRNLFGIDQSAARAKERLRIVLIQDQSSISSELLNVLRNEMIGVVSRYLEIDLSQLEMGIERKNGAIALAATMPILRLRKEGRALVPDSLDSEPTPDRETSHTAASAAKQSEKSASPEPELAELATLEKVAVETGKTSSNPSPKPDKRQRRGRRHLR